ncbi:transporter, major facilitator family protein [Elysia marginata]|uniref:Transporter, major facilitator family protein n=1 Tax=Elysia marginata TaxID=1093978 RepID=A0AAV4FT74_9GAST|nr:transporter, major facilitator family protein [Elysia marginata]
MRTDWIYLIEEKDRQTDSEGYLSSYPDADSVAKKTRRRKVLTACFLLSLPCSMLHFGNVLPYLVSYYHFHRPQAYIEPLWLVFAFQLCRLLGLMVSRQAEYRIGLVKTVATGGAVICVSLLLSTWSMVEPAALFLTFGILYGLGAGVMSPLITKVSLPYMEDKSVWTDTLLTASFPVGGFIYMLLAFLVINPYNERADLVLDHKKIFSDDSLISDVPYYFLTIACITVVPVGVGVWLLHLNSAEGTRKKNYDGEFSDMEEMVLYAAKEEKMHVKKSKTPTGQYGAVKQENGENNSTKDAVNSAPESDAPNKTFLVTKGREYWLDYTSPAESTPTAESLNANEDKPDLFLPKTGSEDAAAQSNKIGREEQVTSVMLTEADPTLSRDLSPSEVLQTRTFWSLWLCMLLIGHTQYIQENLYKLYGQTEISNDALLLLAGLLGMVAIVFARPLSRAALDRWGAKIVSASICAAAAVFMTLMFIFHRFFPPLYIVSTAVEFAAVSCVYLLHTQLPVRLFGETHVILNSLLLSTATVVVCLLDPIIVHEAIATDRWEWLVASGSLTAAASLFGFILLLPDFR